jgi:hypothetical protein
VRRALRALGPSAACAPVGPNRAARR